LKIACARKHKKANSIGSGHAGFDKEFFGQVLNAISDAGEILIIGPAGAKTELAKYLREQHSKIGDRIVAVEAADHPSEPEIVAYARKYFKIAPAEQSLNSTFSGLLRRHESVQRRADDGRPGVSASGPRPA
jgi:hypothetical protein